MGNKQEELEVTVRQETYNLAALTETWWDEPHQGSAKAVNGYKLVNRDR